MNFVKFLISKNNFQNEVYFNYHFIVAKFNNRFRIIFKTIFHVNVDMLPACNKHINMSRECQGSLQLVFDEFSLRSAL